MNEGLLKQDLADLKAICACISDRHRADIYNLSNKAFHGLELEEVLALIIDDFIPASLEAA